MNNSVAPRLWKVIKACVYLGLLAALVYFLFWLFAPNPLKQTHQEIALSNGGIINIDCTVHDPNWDTEVDSKITYKPPSSSKLEYITDPWFAGPVDVSEVSAYVIGQPVVLILNANGGVPFVRTQEGVWKTFAMSLDFPSTNDFSTEDIKLMAITSQRSFPADSQVAGSTTIEHFDPQTRIFLINYSVKSKNKHLTLQLSEDGDQLKLLNFREE